jgi:hypothetical protein
MEITARQVCRLAVAVGITAVMVAFLYGVYRYGWQVASVAYWGGVNSLTALQESFGHTTWWVISAAIYCVLMVCMYYGWRVFDYFSSEDPRVAIGIFALMMYITMAFIMFMSWCEPLLSPSYGTYLSSVIPSGILMMFFVVYEMIPLTMICDNVGKV